MCTQTVEQRVRQKRDAQSAIGLQFAQNAEEYLVSLNSFHGCLHDLRTDIDGLYPGLCPLLY